MEIAIYSTKTCPYCQLEKEYLTDHGFRFTDILVDKDREKALEMMEISGQLGVPFTIIKTDDGQKHSVLGFQKEKISQILGINPT